MLNNLLRIKEGKFMLHLTGNQYGYTVVILESEKVIYKQEFADLQIATETAKTTLGKLVKEARYYHLINTSFHKQNTLLLCKQIVG